MKTIIVFVALLGVTLAAPGLFGTPVVLARLSPAGGAPLGPDGRVVDTPEVASAKADHAAAQQNERVNLAQQEARAAAGPPNDPSDGAPVGPDGRVVDTNEVALAKAQHANAHLAEKANQAAAAAQAAALQAPVYLAVAPAQATPFYAFY